MQRAPHRFGCGASLYLLSAQWLPLGARSSTIVPVVTEQSLQSGLITISNDRLLLHLHCSIAETRRKLIKIGVDKMILYTVI